MLPRSLLKDTVMRTLRGRRPTSSDSVSSFDNGTTRTLRLFQIGAVTLPTCAPASKQGGSEFSRRAEEAATTAGGEGNSGLLELTFPLPRRAT